MQRDIKLVRNTISIKASPSGSGPDELKREGYSQVQIEYHARLIVEAGLAHGQNVRVMGDLSARGHISRLTWQGHDFLDAAGKIGASSVHSVPTRRRGPVGEFFASCRKAHRRTTAGS